jgi:hypothetical protein
MLDPLMHIGVMNKLTCEKQTQITNCLVEGNSHRATARSCDVGFNTVLKLLPAIGSACADCQDRVLRNLTCKRTQCVAFASKLDTPGLGYWVTFKVHIGLPRSAVAQSSTGPVVIVLPQISPDAIAGFVQIPLLGRFDFLFLFACLDAWVPGSFPREDEHDSRSTRCRNPPSGSVAGLGGGESRALSKCSNRQPLPPRRSASGGHHRWPAVAREAVTVFWNSQQEPQRVGGREFNLRKTP